MNRRGFSTLLTILVVVGLGVFATLYFKMGFLHNPSSVPTGEPAKISPATSVGINLTTTKLATVPFDTSPNRPSSPRIDGPYFDPNGRRVVNFLQDIDENTKSATAGFAKTSRVFINDLSGDTYDSVTSYQDPILTTQDFFSPTGQVIYSASKNDRELLVVDGKESEPYESVGPIAASPDGKHLAYFASKNNKNYIYLDGTPQEVSSSIKILKFLPDDSLLWADYGGNQYPGFVVVNGVKGKEYNSIDNLIVSNDGKNIAYTASKNGNEYVVFDTKEEKVPTNIQVGSLTFSPDGQHLAYIMGDKGWFVSEHGNVSVVQDGKKGDVYDQIASGPLFSQNGEHLAYVAKRANEYFVVLDGKVLNKSAQISPHQIEFSPQNELAYVVTESTGKVIYLGGEKIQTNLKRGSNLYFSPDGSRRAYFGNDGKENMIMVDGKNMFIDGTPVNLAFSPDGKHIVGYVFTYSTDGKGNINGEYVWIDGKSGKVYGGIIPREMGFQLFGLNNPEFAKVQFTPDSKYLLYGAYLNSDMWWVAESL